MNVLASTLHAPIFRFDESEHRYWLGDEELASVTTILAASFSFNARKEVAEVARELGTIVHKACELDDLNDLDESTLEPEFRPYLEAWRAFRKEHGFTPDMEGIEVRRYHPQWKYAGTIDRVGRMRSGRHMVLDIKTGGRYAHYQLQLAAYVFLLDNPFDYHRGVVVLNSNGSFDFEEYSKDSVHQDIGFFRSAHNVYKFKREHKLLDRRTR
jgi:hypothetical protein